MYTYIYIYTHIVCTYIHGLPLPKVIHEQIENNQPSEHNQPPQHATRHKNKSAHSRSEHGPQHKEAHPRTRIPVLQPASLQAEQHKRPTVIQ